MPDLDKLVAMWGVVTPSVEFIKAILLKFPLFANLEALTQTIILQIIAWLCGIGVAAGWHVNLLVGADPTFGLVCTGLVVSLGSSGIHIIFAYFGQRASVTAPMPEGTVKAQSAGATERDRFAPFM